MNNLKHILLLAFTTIASISFGQSYKFGPEFQANNKSVNQIKENSGGGFSISNSTEMVAVLVEGDVELIKSHLAALDGTFKYCVGTIANIKIPINNIEALMAKEGVNRIQVSNNHIGPLNDTSKVMSRTEAIENGQLPNGQIYTGEGVIVGFVDKGIDIDHPDFLNDDGTTRILALWDQNMTAGIDDSTPQPYDYGEFWDSTMINNGACDHAEIGTHGSGSAGTVAGNGRADSTYRGYAYNSEIIMVSYNNSIFSDGVTDGIHFIFNYADSLNKPCVINLSVGSHYGAHDGQDLSTQAIEALLEEKNGRVVVAAAGNSGSSNVHIGATLGSDTVFTYFNDWTGSWQANDAFTTMFADSNDMKQVRYAFGVDIMDAASNAYRHKGKTDFINIVDQPDRIDEGDWRIDSIFDNDSAYVARMKTKIISEQGGVYWLQAWWEVNDTYWADSANCIASMFLTGGGKIDFYSNYQYDSYFSQNVADVPDSNIVPAFKNYLMPDNNGSVVSLWQCSPKVITVGNYVNRVTWTSTEGEDRTEDKADRYKGNIEPSSSRGPTRIGVTKPDIAAPGRRTFSCLNSDYTIESHRIVGEGGRYYDATGTSIAAPVVSGIVAMYLEANPTASYSEILTQLKETAFEDNYTGGGPSNTWGSGKIDAFNFIAASIPQEADTVCLGDSSSFTHNGIGVEDTSILMWDWNNDETYDDTTSGLTNTYLFDSAGTFTVTCVVKTGATETETTFAALIYSAPSDVDLGADSSVCFGSTMDFDVSGTYDSILWSNGDSDSLTTYGTAGNIIVTLRNDNGCIKRDTMVISLIGINGGISLDNDTSICMGEELDLNVAIADATFLWNDDATDSTNKFTSADTIWAQATKEACAYRDTLILSMDTLPIIAFSDSQFCVGESIYINAGIDSLTYLWSTEATSDSILVAVADTYSLVLTDGNGCSSNDSIIVNQIGATPVSFGIDTTICSGASINLDISADGATFLWHNDSTYNTANFNNTDTIWAQSSKDGCITRDTLILTVDSLPVITFSDSIFCNGQSVVVRVGSIASSYAWSNGADSDSIIVDSAGTYALTVNDGNNCQATDSIEVKMIGVSPVELGDNSNLCAGDTISFDITVDGSSYLWHNDSTQSSLSFMEGDFIWAQMTDSVGCVSRDTVIVGNLSTPTVIFPANSFCEGDSLVLNIGNTNNTILWSTGADTHIVVVNEAMDISVTVSNEHGCSVSESMSVEVFSNPSISLGNDTTICEGASISFAVNGSFEEYRWSDESELSTLSIDSAASVGLTVKDSNNCEATDTVIVNQVFNAGFTLGADTILCTNEEITLIPDTTYTSYSWSDSSTSDSIEVSSPGCYKLMVTDQYGCIYADSIVIGYQDTIVWDVDETLTICLGGTQTIKVEDYFETYVWASDSSNDTAMITINDSGTYILTATHSSGCIAQDSFNVIIEPVDYELSFISSVSAPNKAIFGNQTPDLEDYTFKWFFGDGDSSNSYNPIHNYDVNGDYTVILIATNTINACMDTLTKENEISITQVPGCDHSSNITYDDAVMTCEGDTMLLTANEVEDAVYAWYKGGLAIGGANKITYPAIESGSYVVKIIAGACEENSDAVSIDILELIDTPVIETNEEIDGCSRITLSTTSTFENYLWSNGDNESTTTTKTSGLFTVTAWNEGTCKMTSDTFVVGTGEITATDICFAARSEDSMVALFYDTTLVNGAIDKIYVLRKRIEEPRYSTIQLESNFDGVVYDRPGTHRLDSFRYKFSFKDTCKVRDTSDIAFRVSMLKVLNKGPIWELNWNEYEGLDYDSVILYRKTLDGSDTSNFAAIDTFPKSRKIYSEDKNQLYDFQYKIKFMGATSCADTGGVFTNVFDTDMGIPVSAEHNIANGSLLVYPNPVSNYLTIEYIALDVKSISIYNIMGSQLDYRNNLEGSIGQIDIDLSQYQSGIYFIEVKTQQGNEVIKIQKD